MKFWVGEREFVFRFFVIFPGARHVRCSVELVVSSRNEGQSGSQRSVSFAREHTRLDFGTSLGIELASIARDVTRRQFSR